MLKLFQQSEKTKTERVLLAERPKTQEDIVISGGSFTHRD